MSKPNLTQLERMVYKSPIWEFERYLPTAFDDTLSLLEKINKIIYELNKLGLNMNDLIDQWNIFVEWVLNEGLEDAVNKKLEEWLKDGTLADLILNLVKLPEATIYVSDKYKGKSNKQKAQFGELTEAFDFIDSKAIQPTAWIILIETPYTIESQISIVNKDYSHVTIMSDDVVLASDTSMRDLRTFTNSPNPLNVHPVIYGENAEMPTLMFSLKQSTKRMTRPSDYTQYCTAITVVDSSITITEGNYITNFNYCGLIAIGSNVFANNVSFNNCGNLSEVTADNVKTVAWGSGISTFASNLICNNSHANSNAEMGFSINQGSTASLNGSIALYNGHHGVMATGGSSVSIKYGNISHTIDDNLVSYGGSDIDARYSTCNNSKSNYGVIATRNSTINFESGVADNNKQSGIMANRGGVIDGTNCSVTGSGVDGCRSANGSTLILTNATIKSSGEDGVTSEHGSTLVLNGATIAGCGKDGVLAYDSSAFGDNCTISNCQNHGIEVTRGGKVAMNYAKITGCKYGVQAYGGEANVSYSAITSCERGILGTQGSLVRAEAVTIGDCTLGIMAYASQIFAMSSKVIDCTTGVQATKGGILNIVDSTIAFNSGNDVECYNGSQIMAQGTSATVFNPTATFNEFSKQGIIMRVV